MRRFLLICPIRCIRILEQNDCDALHIHILKNHLQYLDKLFSKLFSVLIITRFDALTAPDFHVSEKGLCMVIHGTALNEMLHNGRVRMIDGSDHTVETTVQIDRERRPRKVRVNGAAASILRVPRQLVAKASLMLDVLSIRMGEALQASAHAEPEMQLQPVRVKADFRK